MKFVLVIVLAVAVASLSLAPAAAETCQMGSTAPTYPPTEKNMTVPWYDIDLDASPADRWTQVVEDFKGPINDLINAVIDLKKHPLIQDIIKAIDKNIDEYFGRLPAGYGDEIRSIASTAGLDVGVTFILQIMYEVIGLCTSVISQDSSGSIYHSRNLDFGLFMGWDKRNETWLLTEKLRPIIFNARWMKGGKVLFMSTQYAGYIGLHTGGRPGAFSLSVDSRFDGNLDKYLLEWFENKYQASFLTMKTREVTEAHSTYTDAYNDLIKAEMVGPSYVIMGGVNPGEGAVLTYSPGQAGPLNVWDLSTQLKAGSFYILETNYDHWKPAPFFDDRRTPAESCLNNTITQSGVTYKNLFWMMSSVPTLNRLTTFTTLMNMKEGHLEAYKQRCSDDAICPIW